MSSNIILNRNNVVNVENNKLIYKFPSNIKFTSGDTVSLSHLNIYFSWYNISAKNNNNFFQYKWWDNTGVLIAFDVLIKDGYYSVSDLNEYLMNIMVKNGHYVITSGGDYGYFIEFITNSVYYSVELRLSSLAKIMNINGTAHDITTSAEIWAAGDWLPPDLYTCPQVIFPSNNKFGDLLGFDSGTISQDTTGDIINKQYSFLNSKVPNLEPSSSFIVTCSLVENNMGIPNNILHSFTVPNNTSFGDLISPIDTPIYSNIREGTYSEITLQIYDQNFNSLVILDSNMLIVLSIIKKNIL